LKAIAGASRRETQLRLALADGIRAAGDKARALKMLDSPVLEIAEARARIGAGKPLGTAVDTPARAFAELLSGLSLDLMRVNNTAFPVRLLQVARYAAPNSSPSALVLGAILQNRGRTDEALATFRTIRADDMLSSQARDAEARALVDAKRYGAAYVLAKGAADRPGASSADHSRFGDVLIAMKRYGEAAAAYQRALDHPSEVNASDRWTLMLLKASAAESANNWPDAKRDLEAALKLAPEQPMLLNFLGYAKLERGEDLDAAEAMIRKASELAPDDASITDSLGWAQYKRGKVVEAVETLQRAAVADPGQAEIREHLGDALYDAGRKFEARFAWEAALVTADDEIGARVKAKLASGLDKTNRAP
jgi:tetratricopeptide (TPR) repeat protein